MMELDLSKLASSRKKDIDFEALDNVIDNSNYPSELKVEGEAFLSLPTRKVKKHTVQVDPNKTRLWKGNPRNFALVINIDDLLPRIRKSKGNLQPVLARKLAVPDENGCSIEVIFGCRRRLCTIEANTLLTVDMVDINDEEAKQLVIEENGGRKDNDFIADCRYLKSEYERLKTINGGRLSVEDFASMHEQARQTMSEKLHIAALPDELLVSVEDTYSWTLRNAVKVKSCFNSVGGDDEKEELFSKLKTKRFPKVDSLLKFFADLSGANKKTLSSTYDLNGTKVQIKKDSKNIKIQIPTNCDQSVVNEIEAVLKKYASN